MNITIHHLEQPEMQDALFSLTRYAFHPSPPFQNKEETLEWIRESKGVTCCAVDAGEEPLAIAASTAMTQNVRGGLYAAAGVWGVSTHPSARRKGYSRQALTSLLAAEREAGKVFSDLYPFRESFYERLGYVTFPLTKIAKFTTQALAPSLKLNLDGEVDLKLIGDAYDDYRQYLLEMRQGQHGMALFDDGDRARANRNHQWVAAARFGGDIEGIMLYQMQGEQVTKFNFMASRFFYKTSRARALLLNWIARHVDQAERAEVWLPADETPETWQTDIQVMVETAVRAPMCRVLDVAGIGGMDVGEGSFSAQIIDPTCPWNEGAWRFEASDGKLVVSRASSAEYDLTIQGLTALISGTHDPETFLLRGWGNPDSAAQSAQRKLFPRLCPFLYEIF